MALFGDARPEKSHVFFRLENLQLVIFDRPFSIFDFHDPFEFILLYPVQLQVI